MDNLCIRLNKFDGTMFLNKNIVRYKIKGGTKKQTTRILTLYLLQISFIKVMATNGHSMLIKMLPKLLNLFNISCLYVGGCVIFEDYQFRSYYNIDIHQYILIFSVRIRAY